MTTPSAVQQKTLFVGSKRICQQIAYVLDLRDYTLAEKLTLQNYEQFCAGRIYVCEFKRKSGELVAKEVFCKKATNIYYLEDVCRKLDQEYVENRKRHKNDLRNFKVALTENHYRETFTQRARQLLRAMRDVGLRVRYHVQKNITKHIIKRYRYQKQIPHQYLRYLRCLKPSELLLYVLYAEPNPHIQCTRLEANMQFDEGGNIKGCSSVAVPFGNLLYDGEVKEIFHSAYARIVKLSSLNRSHCLCNFHTWCKGYCSGKPLLPTENWETPMSPKFIFLTFDRSCNLCCKSCRTKPYRMDRKSRQCATVITTKLLRSGVLEQVDALELAGSGETFYSPYYRQVLTTDLQRKQIKIKSNGVLFDQNNWQLLVGKYTTIDVNISVDAATEETYRKLRGANWNQLQQNLQMLSDLHRQKQIRKFNLNFVVQRDNFREMPAFVQLGKSLGVDKIQFQRLNQTRGMTAQQLHEQCLIMDNQYLDYELWCVLQDPIFNDPIVDLSGLQRYLDVSEQRYRQ